MYDCAFCNQSFETMDRSPQGPATCELLDSLGSSRCEEGGWLLFSQRRRET